MFVIPHGVTFQALGNAIAQIEQAIQDKTIPGTVYAADVYPTGIALTLTNKQTYYIDPCTNVYTLRGNQYARLPVPLTAPIDDWRAPRRVLDWPKLRIKVR